MSHINFVIPQNKSELLSDTDQQYYVRNVVSIKEIQVKLREAKQCFKDEGPEFILDNFDTFYSVLHHSDTLQMDIIMKAYEDLHRATHALNNVLGFLLDDKDSLNDELNTKYLNVIKMLLYVYTNIVIMIEQKVESKKSQTLQPKGRQRKKTFDDDLDFGCNKKDVLLALSNIVQREINLFWDPPIAEEMFVSMVSEVCYRFLEISSIKAEKEMRTELFSMLGTLIKGYNHGMTFVVRIVQLIKIHEHLVQCVPDGIQLLVQNYNCKSLVRDFVQEVTEWQTDEKFQDLQGTKHCSAVLFEMANLMPNLMIPEVMYLSRYLAHDSYTLRNSVLHVITEVILNVLTKTNLTEEQRESRDEFLTVLEEHIEDISAHVRGKVFQHWARLQQENAIPIKIQAEILKKAARHLRDKAANVRKCAANCVTTFLSHNIYGAKLQLDEMEQMYNEKKGILDNLKQKLEDSHLEKLREVQQQWLTKEENMRAVIAEKLKEGCPNKPAENEIPKDHLSDLVRLYVSEDKFSEAFELCRSAGSMLSEWQETKKNMNVEEQAGLYLTLIRAIFTDIGDYAPKNSEKGDGDKAAPSEDELNQLVSLENTVEYLNGAVNFLNLIDSTIKPMADLLESASVGDMLEAIEFFVAAYKFNINNSLVGVLEMLKIMQRNEQERKDHIINAFKTIYLTTDATNMREHTTIIINRLINLLQTVPYENHQDLSIIISEWISKGILDNSIIDMLWQYFTKKLEVSDDESRAAANLLTMASMGRKTIASKNINLIATIAFGGRGKKDLLLVTAGCELLQAAGREKQEITDKDPPFRIKAISPIWKDLVDVLIFHFYERNPYYNGMMSQALNFIYRLCSKPEKICEELTEKIINSVVIRKENSDTTNELEDFVITQCNHMLGEIALKQLNFLDEAVYKELKRRNYIREERKTNQKNNKKKITKVQNASARKRFSNSNLSHSKISEDSIAADESTLEGAQADDTDAEFILNVLENNTVSESSALGKLAYLIVSVCEQPNVYDDVVVQGTSIVALLRYMIVSSQFCQNNLQLIFTILEKTKYPEVKCSILIHCSDLLERFPNLIEPWTPRLYDRLRDDCTEVRKAAFFMLANLILRDMLRVQGYISEMACCMVDQEETLKNMSKNFFTLLSRKVNTLYNVLPDIFSHLNDMNNLEEENLRFIMKFLFNLIDKNKQMESLVDRFCSKFRLTEDDYKCRNIAFCLSLIQYNEKGLRRLSDNFLCYKNTLLIDDVYAIFKQILTSCSKSVKNEVKELAKEIEEKINTVFETEEDGKSPKSQLNRTSRPTPQKSAFKKPRGRAPKKKSKKSRNSDSDDSDEEEKENSTPAKQHLRRSNRTPRKAANNISDDSDSSD